MLGCSCSLLPTTIYNYIILSVLLTLVEGRRHHVGSDYTTYIPSNPGRLVEVLLKFSGHWLVIVTMGRHSMRDMKKLTAIMFLIQRFFRGLLCRRGRKEM
jgi:hypothetical protein